MGTGSAFIGKNFPTIVGLLQKTAAANKDVAPRFRIATSEFSCSCD
jgi:hypothetical protein